MSDRRTKYADLSKTGPNLVNSSAVIEAVQNILNTRVGEYPFNRDFGTYIEDYLFDNFSFATSRSILSEVIASVSRWEPRVNITPDTDVEMDLDSRVYKLFLYVEIEGFSDPVLVEKDFLSKEAE